MPKIFSFVRNNLINNSYREEESNLTKNSFAISKKIWGPLIMITLRLTESATKKLPICRYWKVNIVLDSVDVVRGLITARWLVAVLIWWWRSGWRIIKIKLSNQIIGAELYSEQRFPDSTPLSACVTRMRGRGHDKWGADIVTAWHHVATIIGSLGWRCSKACGRLVIQKKSVCNIYGV